MPYSHGTLIGSADTAVDDATYSNCPSGFCDGYRQDAFTWHDGTLTDLGVLPGTTGSDIYQLNDQGVGAGAGLGGIAGPPNTGNPSGLAAMFEHGRVIALGVVLSDVGQAARTLTGGL